MPLASFVMPACPGLVDPVRKVCVYVCDLVGAAAGVRTIKTIEGL